MVIGGLLLWRGYFMGRFVNLGNNAFQTALTIYSHKFIIWEKEV